VGFVGLGTMGRGMARRLVAAGLAVEVYDVNQVAVDELVAAGATAAESLESLGATREVLAIAVVDDEQVRTVLGIPHKSGLLAHAASGTVVLIHSTIHPDMCRELAELARLMDVTVLDAPMTGNPGAAATGRLSMMVGGDAAALERARPALVAYAAQITHLGPVGTGQAAKIANNLAIAITLRGVREALALAEALGISTDAMLPLLASGGADSWVARNWRTIGETADGYPGGAQGLSDLTRKDVALALDLAYRAGVAIPTGALSSQLLADAYLAAEADALAARAVDNSTGTEHVQEEE
jgi:3-hydroxyisobutyrate dehydrogenase-like beta-hydroxyacid dehydrogenase